ncbi:hypothetical protein [Bradyrhizobium sp.]|uniref:hypothetical protein n=1 Tax=Bradyrhizobium sp. TaxID=376 RepID=UPI002617D26C|nr:hypothetical protein [Bradyrhizobium sp.]
MTKLQDKAQAQVKKMVGQMIGDDRLVQEGKEQQQKADQPKPTANEDLAKERESSAQPTGPRPEPKR